MKLNRIVPAVLAAAVLALTACSSPSGTGATPTPGDALADLKKAGVLKVGTEGTYSPFTYHDPKTNELTGYDVEVTKAVAEKLGVKAEFSETKWDSIFPALEAKRFDVIANQVGINAERTAKYDLSDPYTVSYPVVVVRADNTGITTLADVKGHTSGQTATSNWADFARKAGAEIVPAEGFTETVALIRDGRVDLTFNDNLAVLEYFKSTGDTSVKVAFEQKDQKLEMAFALRKDSGLVEGINGALKELAADGTLAKLGEKYFGQDVSK
ncbi:MAG: amino acid ABC transporter substrate-binding protein [Propioniciclava sp.]|uniref:amino acid ABC transporter substrate-binding protein n=1 Tax=Propioniciclava sp. TaxID=2038686 RepID=UPI0039E267CF